MRPTLLVALSLCLQAAEPTPARWQQFRGPNASGVGSDNAKPPVAFGPAQSLLWKVALPTGHGSPCIWGDRLFVTAFDSNEKALSVIAINRKNGKVLWRQPLKTTALEPVHAISSPATTTPVTDGETVYVYLGSFGFAAFTLDGKLSWEHPLPTSKMGFGSGTSPVLAGDLLLITRDYLPKPLLIAVNRKDGKLAWQKELAPLSFQSSGAHSTPLVLKDQLVLHRPSRVSGHSLVDGSELWWVKTASVGTATVTEHDGVVYVAAFNGGASGPTIAKVPFDQALAQYDMDKDGKLSRAELPPSDLYLMRRADVPDSVPGAHMTVKSLFNYFDADKDGSLNRAEYDMSYVLASGTGATSPDVGYGLMAIRLGGSGDVSSTAVVWQQRRSVPEVSAPLVYRDKVYMVTAGGIFTCVDEKTGQLVYRGRINAPGAYYSSPVAAGGKVFVASGEGIVTSLEVGPELKVLANNDLGEPVYGTPALIGSQIYIRSVGHLWAFGPK
ncbi:MAG: PQQ-binding-like beta-propeller repeat protein [Acidobacteria bacterium]|nr:PQQ-binding-like beta-propeller repeat protein [Acidobacteriota bacterium]